MRLSILAILIFLSTSLSAQIDISDKVVTLLEAGNSKGLSVHFSNKIDLAIEENDDVFSSAQAELILKKFFSSHKPAKVTVVHSGTSKLGVKYNICTMDTNNGAFSVIFHIKKVGGKYLIQKLSIEEEDE